MRKSMKKIMVVMLTLAMMIPAVSIEAKTQKKQVKVVEPKITATCTAAGTVNIHLKNVASLGDVAVTIADEDGQKAEVKIVKKTKTLVKVKVEGITKGLKYTTTVSGLMAANATETTQASTQFVAKRIKTNVKAQKTKVAASPKGIVKVMLKGKAVYENATVTVTDAKGQSVDAKIIKLKKSYVSVKISDYQKKMVYKVVVTGVKAKKDNNFGSVECKTKAKK